MSQLFTLGGQSIRTSASVLQMNVQEMNISFRINWFDIPEVQGPLKSPSPARQFESINSLALSLFYSPTLTSVHDHWKYHIQILKPMGQKVLLKQDKFF